jgi:Methyltransferase domain
VDIGGGDSRLVDHLIERSVSCLAVLDVSSAALTRAQQRLGPDANRVQWLEYDVTDAWSVSPRDIWHDRAVFHFLTDADDRQHYVQHLRDTLKLSGSAIVATFALDGPEKCTGLPVMRYSPETLAEELGQGFALIESVPHQHQTPWGSIQSFQYSRFVRVH